MWLYGDPKEWTEMAERRWNRERTAAAHRRLMLSTKPQRQLPSVFTRAQRAVEHMFHIAHRNRTSTTEEPADTLSDVQMARLLALLAPDGEVLRLKPADHRQYERDEESRASG